MAVRGQVPRAAKMGQGIGVGVAGSRRGRTLRLVSPLILKMHAMLFGEGALEHLELRLLIRSRGRARGDEVETAPQSAHLSALLLGEHTRDLAASRFGGGMILLIEVLHLSYVDTYWRRLAV